MTPFHVDTSNLDFVSAQPASAFEVVPASSMPDTIEELTSYAHRLAETAVKGVDTLQVKPQAPVEQYEVSGEILSQQEIVERLSAEIRIWRMNAIAASEKELTK